MIDYDEVSVGDELPAQTFEIRREDLVRYCGASGDFNPLHWNEGFAKGVGLPNVIAHGMFTMAAAARVVTDWVADPGAVAEYSMRFTRPVVVPDGDGAVLDVAGRVTGKRAGALLDVDVTATANGQTVVARARLVVRVGGGHEARA